jgi:hypothetical protein
MFSDRSPVQRGSLKPFMSLRFVEHQAFHRAAAWMMAGGVAAGMIAGLAGAGITGALFAGATGAVLGAGWADREAGAARLAARAVLLAVAVGAFALVRELAGGHLGVLAMALVLGVALNLGGSWRRTLAALLVGGGIAYVGGYAAGQVMIARETAPLPGWLEVTLASAAMSGVCIAALLPRHLLLLRDAVAAARRSLPTGVDAEVKSLLDRGVAVWDQVSPQLGDDDRALLCEGVLKMHDLAARMARADVATESAETLEARRADLDARIAASTDDLARTQYQEARAAVEDQVRYAAQIRTARERVIARLHACVTTLEKFRLAAARQSTLAEVSAEIAACGQAIAELEAPAAAAA